MKRTTFFLLFVCVAVVAFGSPGANPTIAGSSESGKDAIPLQLSQVVYFPEFRESVAFTGNFSAHWKLTTNGTGCQRLLWEMDLATIEGHGLSSGKLYRMSEAGGCEVQVGNCYPVGACTAQTILVTKVGSIQAVQCCLNTNMVVLGSLVDSSNALLISTPPVIQKT